MASLDLVWNLIARDGASPAFLKVGSAAEGTAAKTDLASASIGRLGGAFAGFAAGAAVVAAVKSAEQFQAKMLLIQTQSGATAQEVRNMSPAILSLAGKVAQAPEELATSLYHVESTGLRGAKALEAVKIAAEGARVGHADLEETTNALTATIASGMLPATETYSQAMGALNTIVGSGDMKMQDLNEALGTGVLVTTKQYGITLNDVGAALADFGDNNIRGADAATSLRMAVQALQTPGANAAEALGKIGLTTQQLATDEQTGGLNKALTDLHTHLVNSGIDASQWGQLLTEAFTKKAGGGILTLVGTFDRFQQKYEEVSRGSDSFGAAWEATTKSTAFQFAALKDSIDAVGIKLGTYLLPILGDLAQGFTLAFAGVDKAITFFANLPGPVEAGAVALGAFLLLTGPLSGFFETIALKAMYMADTLVTAAGEGSLAMGALSTAGEGLMTMFGGPWGIAITGVTIGLGYLINWLGKADDATKESAAATEAAASAQKTYQQALTDSNGVISESIRMAAAKALQDEGLLDSGKKAGINLQTMTDGILGQGDAYDKVIPKLQDYAGSLRIEAGFTHDQKAADAWNKEADAVDRQIGNYKALAATQPDVAAGQQQLAEAAGATTEQTQAAADAQKKWIEQLQQVGSAFVDPLAAYQGLLQQKTADEQAAAQATADSTASTKDSWKDYVKDVSVSLDEYATKLEEQITNQENWRQNIATVTQRGGIEIGQILAGMGVQGAQITGQMATATADDFNRMKNDLITNAQEGGAGAAAALDSQMKIMAEIGKEGGAATALSVSQALGVGLDQVAATAAQYGAALATGINPVLASLGPTRIVPGTSIVAGYGHFAVGGYTGDGAKYTPAGIVHKGEFVMPQEAVQRIGVATLGAMAGLPGYAGGGFVTAADVPAPYSTAPTGPPVSTAADGTMAAGFEAARAFMAKQVASAPGAPGNVSANAALGRILAGNQGWGSGAEWNALYALWQRESGWNNNAQNPTSTAYGIPQFLDSTWASVGSRKSSDSATQINAGLSYIRSRYGDPLKAWAHEVGAGWYEQGTNYVPRTGPAVLHEGEAVLTKAENAARMAGGPVEITGRLTLDPDGFVRIVDGRLTDLYRQKVRT